ncbi:MAG: hypothetical protein ABID87_07915 [Chloroflexota bacterium]
MVEPEKSSPATLDDFSRAIDEYRAKIDQIVHIEREKYRKIADEESSEIVNGAWRKAEEIVAGSQEKARKDYEEIMQRARTEADILVTESQSRARQITAGAEEGIAKEAKKRTRGEVDRILSKAHEEASNIIALAKHAAEKEARSITASVEKEKEQRIRQAMEAQQAEAQAHAAKTMAEARDKANKMIAETREKAGKMMEDFTASNTEVADSIMAVVQRTDKLLDGFRGELQQEMEAVTRVMAEARGKLVQVKAETVVKSEAEATLKDIEEELDRNAVLSVQLFGDKGQDIGALFKGKMEMRTISPYHFMQIRKLRNLLAQVPSIKLLEEYASEEETTLLFDVKEPLPMLEILRKLPAVENAEGHGDRYKVVLKD